MNRVHDGTEALIESARTSEPVLKAIGQAQEQVTAAILQLNVALAALQKDPGDVGERIKRAIVLRGTVENLVNEGFRVKSEQEMA